ncbi:Pentatricopeptide repeat-containing protein [Vigna angularis]|uniref:Pentatricopeptide repeat-containing protein n=1 Tax=Phaseolus angularis TaxID=3914 RepID=A0A8T0K9X2_PHAAN|nr:pentatricopeptide repeat-containing protein At1g10270 [Vigna angularis]KAG2396401.1 Pentatricopeptide repeat-containing protein [Vigna angularis]
MSLHRLLLRRLSSIAASRPIFSLTQTRSYAFSSAEEAAAERRRRKRRLRIEPPLNAIRPPPQQGPPRDPNAPRLPDSTSALVGPRLSLHNRVQSLIRAGDLEAASAIARHAVFSVTRPTVFTCNAIIAAMYRSKRYEESIALFHFFFNQFNIVPNIVSYNNVINTHCDEGRVDVALAVYRHVLANAPFSPSPVTYRHLTKGLIQAGRISEAVDLLREMLTKGHGADSLVYNNLISGFLELENLEKANELFDELKERCLVYDGVVNSTFMEWFFKKGRDKEAMESYRSLLERQFRMTPATCNVLLECLLKHARKTEAWALFDHMLDNHTPPNFQAVNSDTFNLMVNECFKLGNFEEALATFKKVGTKPNSKPFAMDVAGYNNIIARFCENGMLSQAETLFEELCSKSLSPDVPTHKTLIEAYLRMERIDDALRVFNRMADTGLRVVAAFGNMVFDKLIKNGKASECAQILSKLGEKDPKPDPTCYEVVIKGLCAHGLLDKSVELLDEVMRYGVGVTTALRECVTEVFKEAGRGDEIERLLDVNRFAYTPRPSPPRPAYRAPHNPHSGPPTTQMAAQLHPPPPFQMSGATLNPSGFPTQRAAQSPTPPSSQMTGAHYPPSGFQLPRSQMAGAPHNSSYVAPHQVSGHERPPMHQPSWKFSPPMTGPHTTAPGPSPHILGQSHHPSTFELSSQTNRAAPQMTAQHYTPSGPSPQMGGYQPYATPSGPSPQMGGYQPYATPRGLQQMSEPRYPPSGVPPPIVGQHPPAGPAPPVSGSYAPSYGASPKMSPPYRTAPGPSSHLTGPYGPSSGVGSHFEESHQQQSEVPEQVAA